MMRTRGERELETALQRCRAELASLYGLDLEGVVLYGSMARGDAEEGSDMDLLVVLRNHFDYCSEVRRIVDALYPIQLETDALISAKPALAEHYNEGRLQLYRNARREGRWL